MISLTLFEHYKSKDPIYKNFSILEAYDFFVKPKKIETVSKENRQKTFSMAIYKDFKKRNKSNVEEMSGFVLDFDNKDSFDPIEKILANLDVTRILYFWYTTHSHTDQIPRWRLIVPFKEPIHSLAYPEIYNKMLVFLGNPSGLGDSASRDIAHMWYIPYKNADHEFKSGSNMYHANILDPKTIDKYLTLEQLDKISRENAEFDLKWQKHMRTNSFESKFVDKKTIEKCLTVLCPHMIYSDWISVGMCLHYHFFNSKDPMEGFRIWDKWSSSSYKYKGPEDLARHWRSFKVTEKSIGLSYLSSMCEDASCLWDEGNYRYDKDYDHPSDFKCDETLEKKTVALTSINISDFLAKKIDPIMMLVDPIIPTQGLTMIYAPRGIGKTYLTLCIAYILASGKSMFDDRWSADVAEKILFIDGEMPAKTLQDRIQSFVNSVGLLDDPNKFEIITPDLQECQMPDLSTREGQLMIEPHLSGVKLVVLDNLSSLFRSGEENDSASWQFSQEWLLDLRRRGISVLLVHHANKTGGQRGTSKREDLLDTIISLKRPKNYQSSEGARFEIHYEKARGFCGDAAINFEVQLCNKNNEMNWIVKEKNESEFDAEDYSAIIEAKNEGLSIRKTAEKTGMHKRKVERMLHKIKDLKL